MRCKKCERYIVANCQTGDGFCTLPKFQTRQCKNCEWYTQDSETRKGYCTLFEWDTDKLGFDTSNCELFECIGDAVSIFDE